jgi:hypothetical protein
MVYIYESSTTNNTYMFNTMLLNQSDAETYCQDNGGHLISYAGADEQSEVEGYYIDRVGSGECRATGCSLDAQHCMQVLLQARDCTNTPCCCPQGYLIPANHTAYWMGLVAVTRTQWRWLEPSVPSLSGPGKVYTNWGMPADGRREPNNRQPPEDCGAADMAQLANGAGGWADANCQVKLTFMCKMIRERPPAVRWRPNVC